MTAIAHPPAARPQRAIRLGADTAQACARIRRWSRFLAVVGLLSTLLAGFLLVFVLLADADVPLRGVMVFGVAIGALVSIIPTVLMFRMASAFAAVPAPATVATLVAPVRALRAMLRFAVVYALLNLFVVLVVGVVNLVAPDALMTFVSGRPGKTIAAMREVAAAIDDYAREHHSYPDANSYGDLVRILGREGGDDPLPSGDAWGQPFLYEAQPDSGNGPSYSLTSLGADGVRRYVEPRSTSARGQNQGNPDDADIVIDSGAFVEGPPEILGPAATEERE